MYINKYGYLERKSKATKIGNGKASKKSWFLIKWNSAGTSGYISIQPLTIPKEYIGKRIRVKVIFEKVEQVPSHFEKEVLEEK